MRGGNSSRKVPGHSLFMDLGVTLRGITLFVFCALLVACTAPAPKTDLIDYRTRAESRVDGGIRVSAAVLSAQETENNLSLPLYQKGIQPIWIEVANEEDKPFVLMLLSIDPDYYAPSEVGWMFRGTDRIGKDNIFDFFLERHVPIVIPPKSTVSGFVYTNLDPGAKAFAVELLGELEVRSFEFVQLVPGFEADFMLVDFHTLYPERELEDLELEELREYLESLPCCVLGGDQETPGDPINLVFVGSGRHIIATLVRRGWDLTETMRRDTMWRTVASSLFGAKYRTSPVSELYLFERPQDIAMQKARHSVDERNHLRLWLAPVTLYGESVWVGQISRDIGIKLTSKTLVTHKIDPVVDEARTYIALDVAASETLQAYGYVSGVGLSGRRNPKVNYTNDPYYTDGYRVLLILGDRRNPLDNIDFLPWEIPIRREHRSAPEASD